MNLLDRTLCDIVRSLKEAGIPYAIIGGLAASVRGEVRATEDVEIVLACDVDDAADFLNAATNGEAPAANFSPYIEDTEQIVRQGFLLPLVHRVTGVRVDLAVGMTGFERMVVNRATPVALVEGLSIPVATAEDLILFKLIAGRPQDHQDIEMILKRSGDTLDWGYCIATAEAIDAEAGLTLASQLEQLREASR